MQAISHSHTRPMGVYTTDLQIKDTCIGNGPPNKGHLHRYAWQYFQEGRSVGRLGAAGVDLTWPPSGVHVNRIPSNSGFDPHVKKDMCKRGWLERFHCIYIAKRGVSNPRFTNEPLCPECTSSRRHRTHRQTDWRSLQAKSVSWSA